MGHFGEEDVYDGMPGDENASLLGAITSSEGDLRGIRAGNSKMLFLFFLFPAIGGLLFGYDIGGTSSAFLTGSASSPAYQGHTLVKAFDMSSFMQGVVTSLSLVGAIVGSIIVFVSGDYLSRRGVLLIAAGFYMGGALITGSAVNIVVLWIGRLTYGIGIGFCMHSAPLYIAEIAPPHLRGLLISLKECFIVLGILVGFAMGYVFDWASSGWRYVYDVAAIPALVMFIGVYMIPPSARWMALRAITSNNTDPISTNSTTYSRDMDDAHEALCDLRRLTREETQFEFNVIVDSLQETLKEPFHWKNFLEERVLWRGLIIGLGLVMFQQFTGQPSVLYYASDVFETAGLGSSTAVALSSVGVAFVKLLVTGVSTALVDRAGRRILLLCGIFLMCIALAILSVGYLIYPPPADDGSGAASGDELPRIVSILVILAMMIYVSGYQVGFGPISWTMISEIFPLHVRSQALSIAVIVNFVSNVIVTITYKPLQDLLTQGGAYMLYLVIAVAAIVFTFLLVPETKNRSLEQIEELLVSGVVVVRRRRAFPYWW
eukprot:TRINITY_DN2315_c0_g1_i1.p1 TRINITY_DN2315_c0_g1~~TRINITY_DN2315_c0_g1_i1.p1  ORF type:complete len:546 (-),score=205.46 TRINITY_DN2315_c0_g1_i1:1385-3022(-)